MFTVCAIFIFKLTYLDCAGLENNHVSCFLNAVFQSIQKIDILKCKIFEINEDVLADEIEQNFVINLKRFFATLQVLF